MEGRSDASLSIRSVVISVLYLAPLVPSLPYLLFHRSLLFIGVLSSVCRCFARCTYRCVLDSSCMLVFVARSSSRSRSHLRERALFLFPSVFTFLRVLSFRYSVTFAFSAAEEKSAGSRDGRKEGRLTLS